VDAVLAGMSTAHFQRCFLKAKRINYKKMGLIISGTPYKKITEIHEVQNSRFGQNS
jgi:hypothetical protein